MRISTTVAIGLPVYNGERYLRQAIESILGQSWADWRLHVSDNASTDGTWCIVQEFCSRDPRITATRLLGNIGAAANFHRVLEGADCDFFCWFSHDDVWGPLFLETCMGLLEDPSCGFAFTNIEQIAADGSVLRNDLRLQDLSHPDHAARIARYLQAPEIMGKANLIYSVFRRDVLDAGMHRTRRMLRGDPWGGDMIFNYALILHHPFRVSPHVMFQKRFPQHPGGMERPGLGNVVDPRRGVVPRDLRPAFFSHLEKAALGTPWHQLTVDLLRARSESLDLLGV